MLLSCLNPFLSHSNQEHREHISSSSSGNTEARPWDGNCYYRGDESRDFEGRCFRKMRTAAQTPGHISAKLCCLCAGSDTPQLLTERAVVGLHERLIWERSKGKGRGKGQSDIFSAPLRVLEPNLHQEGISCYFTLSRAPRKKAGNTRRPKAFPWESCRVSPGLAAGSSCSCAAFQG